MNSRKKIVILLLVSEKLVIRIKNFWPDPPNDSKIYKKQRLTEISGFCLDNYWGKMRKNCKLRVSVFKTLWDRSRLTWKKVSRENGKNQEKNGLGLCRAVVVSGRGGFHIDRQSKFQKLIRLEIFDLLIFKTPVDLRKIYLPVLCDCACSTKLRLEFPAKFRVESKIPDLL